MSDALEAAFRAHQKRVNAYLRRRTRDADRAEELTQQVFADAASWLARAQDDRASPTLALLYTVARRRFADEARRLGDRRHVHLVDAPRRAEQNDGYSRELVSALRAACRRLAPDDRAILVGKLVQGHSFADLADTYGLTIGASKMRYVRALRVLRAELEREGVEP